MSFEVIATYKHIRKRHMIMIDARQYQKDSEQGSRFMLGWKRSHWHARALGGKDQCFVRLTGIEQGYWMCTEVDRSGRYGFQGTIIAGDGCNQKGVKMGAGQWRKQFVRMFGPALIRINWLIKTTRSTVSKNRAERDCCFAA